MWKVRGRSVQHAMVWYDMTAKEEEEEEKREKSSR